MVHPMRSLPLVACIAFVSDAEEELVLVYPEEILRQHGASRELSFELRFLFTQFQSPFGRNFDLA